MVNMGLNKTSGNMYGFVTHTWNPVGGECQHNCKYCYIKNGFLGGNKYQGNPYLADLDTNLGSGNEIFVGSATDIFAENVSEQIIRSVLEYCNKFDNVYIFQTKNPRRFLEFEDGFPERTIFTTTMETDDESINLSSAPNIDERATAMKNISGKKMITIEPIVDFNVDIFASMLEDANPDIITIGADSGDNGLPEPDSDDVKQLIKRCNEFAEVRKKHNLNRLM